MANPDPLYLALLGSAETFRAANPPNIKLCIQCLHGVLNCKPPPRIEARTHLQLGNVLLNFSHNPDLARQHLEKSWRIAYSDPSLEDVKLESVSTLSDLFVKQGDATSAVTFLHKGLDGASMQSHYWKCRLIFQLSQLYIDQNDLNAAYQLLTTGCALCSSIQSSHTELLFLLSKGMVALLMNNSQETASVMSACGPRITQYAGSPENKEMLKAFFLTLQVTHYLSCGMTKTVKPFLRQLQECIANLSTAEESLKFNPTGSGQEVFQWMAKEHLCILVYLVSVLHSVQAGSMDKAQKYTEKALAQIQGLKTLGESPLLDSFQIVLLENIIMCHISTGNKATAIKEISQVKFICLKDSKLYQGHKSQLHTLLGLYAMAMSCTDHAVSQFQTALMSCTDVYLWTFINLNLGIVYARTNRQNEFLALLEHIHPHRVPQESFGLKAGASYVSALHRFFQGQYAEAKLFLQETLKIANSEDLNKLTSCSLVLLGQMFLHQGKTQEVVDMVTPALQLAQKIPEVNIQLWGTALLRDLYRACGDFGREAQESHMHQTHTHQLFTDHCHAAESQEHSLIQWLGDLSQTDYRLPTQAHYHNGTVHQNDSAFASGPSPYDMGR